ncbi:unnamed protein product [Cuscuta epithymum]|uniref:DUF4378 domain-containing protein n=1 Tax=Cuscuta epithymum TaxID=186058 RepID=A0AAV0E7B9_9ASTE|nr:unnamed protein product [Cuscuta epithymum]
MASEIQSCVKDKQMGCINGIFQLFDRRHFFTGKRGGCNISKITVTGANHNNVEPITAAGMKVHEKNFQEFRGNQRESDTLSYSTCPSTPSSLDEIKSSKLGLSIKTGIKEEQSVNVMKHIDSPRPPFQQSHDLRDVVKDSMYREARSLPIPVKDGGKEEGRRVNIMKHIDSPRPSMQSNLGRSFSTRIQLKFFEAPLHSTKETDKDPCRFSYDERETRENTLKSMMKQGDRPRLSLDSRVRSIRSETKPSFPLQNLNEGENDELGSHRRPSSVVAKLMGLESFPEEPTSPLVDNFVQQRKQNQETFSSRMDSSLCSKPTTSNSSSRLPIEYALWSRLDSTRSCQKLPLKSKEASKILQQVTSSSIYGEVEKRMSAIELDKSSKDMRALKHILKAMQETKSRLDNKTKDISVQKNNHTFLVEERSPPLERFLSSNPIKQSTIVNDKARKRINTRKSYPNQTLPSIQRMNKTRPQAFEDSEEHMSGGRESISPRLQKRKIDIEKQYDMSRVSKNQNKKPNESEYLNQKQHSKLITQKQGYDHLINETIRSDRGRFSKHSDAASVKSESDHSFASCIETDFTSTFLNIEMEGKCQEVHKATNEEVQLCGDSMMPGVTMPVNDQPSPVSVLDATFFVEDSPSPVKKKKSIAFEEHGVMNVGKAERNTKELENLSCSTTNNLVSEGNLKHMLLNSAPWEDHISELSPFYQNDTSDHQYITKILLASSLFKDLDAVSTTAQLHPSGHLINPMLFHVLEQAEKRSLPTCRGPPKKLARMQYEQKTCRKLVFDTVNEILVDKLAFEYSVMQGRSFSGQKILKELYAEMDHLRPESDYSLDTQDDELVEIIKGDLKNELEDWVKHRGELPSLVLDIERLIFKDLLTEEIGIPRRHPRRLFTF